MRVLVTGSRKLDDRELVWNVLEDLYREWLPTRNRWELFKVIHGRAAGADTLAAEWARHKGDYAMEEGYMAHWDLLGAQAGHERNARMIKDGQPDLVVAFPRGVSIGTRDCMRQARVARIPIKKY